MSEEKLAEISDKLDKLIRLQAINVVKDEQSEQGKVAILDSLGFRPFEIAKMLGKTQENVNVVLSNIRKKKSAEGQKPAPERSQQPVPQTTITDTGAK